MKQRLVGMIVAGTIFIGAASAQELKQKRFADGSGAVGVAPGWSLKQSGNGAAGIVGPGGAEVLLGINIPVVSSAVEQIYQGSGIPNSALFPGSVRVNFADPVRALVDLMAQSKRWATAEGHITRIRRVEPIAWANGKAAFVQFSGTSQGKTTECFGLFAIQPVDNVTGIFYFSSVIAPTGSYTKLLPTMMAMWKSWSLSDATQRQRLDSARKSLAEVDWAGASDSVLQHRRQVAETAAREFQRYIRQ